MGVNGYGLGTPIHIPVEGRRTARLVEPVPPKSAGAGISPGEYSNVPAWSAAHLPVAWSNSIRSDAPSPSTSPRVGAPVPGANRKIVPKPIEPSALDVPYISPSLPSVRFSGPGLKIGNFAGNVRRPDDVNR